MSGESTFKTEVLADGFEFLEGPRWREGRLWMSDSFGGQVFTVGLDGGVETVVEVPGKHSGDLFVSIQCYVHDIGGAGHFGGSFRVGLEDWATGPSNLDQLKRAQALIDSVGRQVVTGPEAIEYLDIPFAATRPGS